MILIASSICFFRLRYLTLFYSAWFGVETVGLSGVACVCSRSRTPDLLLVGACRLCRGQLLGPQPYFMAVGGLLTDVHDVYTPLSTVRHKIIFHFKYHSDTIFSDGIDLQGAESTEANNVAHFDKVVVQDLARC